MTANTARAQQTVVKRISSSLISHNVLVGGKRTSVRLEKEMWMAFKSITILEGCSIHDLCTVVHNSKKPATTLTAAIRVFIMVYFQSASTVEGHRSAGHGQGASIAESTINKYAKTPYYGLRTMISFQGK